MTRMIRKQLYITSDQEERLKAAAQRRGQTEADIVRSCLDSGLTGEEEERLEAIEYMGERFAEVAELAKTTPQSARDWTREDLYEDI